MWLLRKTAVGISLCIGFYAIGCGPQPSPEVENFQRQAENVNGRMCRHGVCINLPTRSGCQNDRTCIYGDSAEGIPANPYTRCEPTRTRLECGSNSFLSWVRRVFNRCQPADTRFIVEYSCKANADSQCLVGQRIQLGAACTYTDGVTSSPGVCVVTPLDRVACLPTDHPWYPGAPQAEQNALARLSYRSHQFKRRNCTPQNPCSYLEGTCGGNTANANDQCLGGSRGFARCCQRIGLAANWIGSVQTFLANDGVCVPNSPSGNAACTMLEDIASELSDGGDDNNDSTWFPISNEEVIPPNHSWDSSTGLYRIGGIGDVRGARCRLAANYEQVSYAVLWERSYNDCSAQGQSSEKWQFCDPVSFFGFDLSSTQGYRVSRCEPRCPRDADIRTASVDDGGTINYIDLGGSKEGQRCSTECWRGVYNRCSNSLFQACEGEAQGLGRFGTCQRINANAPATGEGSQSDASTPGPRHWLPSDATTGLRYTKRGRITPGTDCDPAAWGRRQDRVYNDCLYHGQVGIQWQFCEDNGRFSGCEWKAPPPQFTEPAPGNPWDWSPKCPTIVTQTRINGVYTDIAKHRCDYQKWHNGCGFNRCARGNWQFCWRPPGSLERFGKIQHCSEPDSGPLPD